MRQARIQLTTQQNSAPSKRFLPPQRQPPTDPKKPQTPTAASSNSRLINPTSITSSSRFAKTPSTNRPKHGAENHFEEPSPSSSPALPSRLRFSSSVSRHRDIISDESEDEALHIVERATVGTQEGEDLSDLLYLENLRGTKYSPPISQSASHIIKPELESIPKKRRKLSDLNDNARDAIAISSSSSPEDFNITNISDDEDIEFYPSRTAQQEAKMTAVMDMDVDNQPTTAIVDSPPPVMTSKFRMPTPAVFPTPSPSTRPYFKLPSARKGPALEEMGIRPLPDAFSPSRRHGKKDYIVGGAADTVRNWVLGLAAEESKATQTYAREVRVVEARHDGGAGRCLIVKGEDGAQWILVGENGRVRTGHNTKEILKVRVGSLIGIKVCGSGMDLRLLDRDEMHSTDCDAQNGTAGEWNIGIMWDIME